MPRSDDHNFHLEGPGGVSRSTTHASQMRGSFRVRS
jgi:hypothetical protein